MSGTLFLSVAFLALAALAALAYGIAQAGRDGPAGTAAVACKTASVALLAVAAGLGGAPGLVVAGLACGAMGDFWLTRPGTRAFLAGMAAFALGHLAYAAAFFAGAGVGAVLVPAAGLVALAVSAEFWLLPHAGALRWPVRGYGTVIVAMAIAVLTAPGQPLVKAGAGLFLVSDVLLAIALFRARTPALRLALGRILWPAYWLGQALICLGSLP